MTSLITKKGTPPSWIRHFELFECIPFYWKIRINRGILDRNKPFHIFFRWEGKSPSI